MNLKLPLAVVAVLAPFPVLAEDTLAEDEMIAACAEGMVHALECKADYCAAMAELQPKIAGVAAAQIHETCLKQTETDGRRELAARKKLCTTVFATTGKFTIKRSEHDAMQACWKKAACPERVTCWRPHFEKVMKTMMAAQAAKKKK